MAEAAPQRVLPMQKWVLQVVLHFIISVNFNLSSMHIVVSGQKVFISMTPTIVSLIFLVGSCLVSDYVAEAHACRATVSCVADDHECCVI